MSMSATEVTQVAIQLVSKSNPCSMPVIGLGTAADSNGGEATKVAVIEAIKLGYRHFDTALLYGSEQSIGEAIAEALQLGLIGSRDELVITSKLWCCDNHPHLVLPALQKSLQVESFIEHQDACNMGRLRLEPQQLQQPAAAYAYLEQLQAPALQDKTNFRTAPWPASTLVIPKPVTVTEATFLNPTPTATGTAENSSKNNNNKLHPNLDLQLSNTTISNPIDVVGDFAEEHYNTITSLSSLRT